MLFMIATDVRGSFANLTPVHRGAWRIVRVRSHGRGRPAVACAAAQPPAATPYAPKQSDRPTPVDGDEPGFNPIFDGKTLNGWEGDPKYWRVENGALVGEITPATVVKSNTFIIWRGGRPKDFELKLDYRITAAGNSGINYRSVSVPDPVTPGQQVRAARLSVRSGWRETLPREQLRRERAAVCRRARPGHPRRRRPPAGGALDDRGFGGAGGARDR